MASLPLGFERRGDWLVSDRHGIARLDVYHGRTYSVYAWEFPGDDFATLLGVGQNLDEALKLIGGDNG